MDYIIKNSRKEQSDFQILQNEKKYQGKLELIDDKIKITLTLGQSEFKWSGEYAIEQLYKLNAIFINCNTIENSFESLKEILRSNIFELKRDEQMIILNFNQNLFGIPVIFNIQLMQEEISIDNVVSGLSYQMLEMQKEIEELKISQQNKNKQMKQQDEAINSYKKEIEELKDNIKQIQEDNLKQINEVIQKHVLSSFRQPMYSETLCVKDVETISQWIDGGKKKMELKLLYRATKDGFENQKFYDKCSNISQTLIIIKTTQNKRFGGYTELRWTKNEAYVVSNPNQSFIFSLDLCKKFSSNEQNCQHSIYGASNYIGFGATDFYIYNNSNNNYSSATGSHSYGKHQGRTNYDLTGGFPNFTTCEIEVFQVILN